MELRAFSICRVCFEAYPAQLGCPHCAATAAPEPPPPTPALSPRGSVPADAAVTDDPPLQVRPSWTPVVAIASVAIATTLLLATVIQAV